MTTPRVSPVTLCGGCGGRLVCTVCAMPGEFEVSFDELRKEAALVLARIMRGGGETRNANPQIAAARAFLEAGDAMLHSIGDEVLLAEVQRRRDRLAKRT